MSTNDATLIAGLKGLLAGACNTALALFGGAAWPAWAPLAATLLVGFAAYGISLALFVYALRTLGAARAGAYFSMAPLFGVGIALVLWPELPAWPFWLAAALMAGGVWLHLREHHEHAHTFAWDGREPHVHPPAHAALTRRHAHYPDIHHRHPH